MQSLIMKFLLIFLIVCQTMCTKEEDVTCDGRILDESRYLPEITLTRLCQLIKDNRYLVLIKDRLKDPRSGPATDMEFDRDAEAMFHERCPHFENMCNDGVLIGIFVKDLKIRIYAGSKTNESLSIAAREKIISSVKNLLIVKNFGAALESIIGSIKNYVGASQNTYYTVSDQVSDKYYQAKEGVKRGFGSVKEGYYETKEGIKNKYNEFTKTSDEDYEGSGFGRLIFIIFAFSMVGIMCLNLINKAAGRRGSEKVHFHIYAKFLIDLLQNIRKSQDRTLLINQCLICVKTFEKYDPASFKTVRSDETLKFGCGHLYHRGCLDNLDRFRCLACIENVNTTTYEKTTGENRQYISEVDLMRFLDNLKHLYSENGLNEFYSNYPESRQTLETNFGINMISKFGCSDMKGRSGINYPKFEKSRGEFPSATAAAGDTAGGDFREPR